MVDSSCCGQRRRKGNHKPSCYARYWRFWRYCCCLYGVYPAIVAPILSAACILSLYSSAGCEFVDLQVGFEPSNGAWNQSDALLGLFFHQSGIENENKHRERWHTGCQYYTTEFEEAFIENDRTWRVARIMAMIAGISAILCAFLVWLIVFTPVPINILWPGILLPLTMLSFIAEGSKFLIFDIAVCSNALWYPSGVDSPPESAASCALGQSAVYGVVAASLFLVALLVICLKNPEKRILDPDYGIAYTTGNEHDLEADPTDAEDCRHMEEEEEDMQSDFDDVYTAGPASAMSSFDPDQGEPSMEEGSLSAAAAAVAFEGPVLSSSSSNNNKEPQVDKPLKAAENFDEKQQRPAEEQQPERISESRISKLQEMKLSATVAPGDNLVLQLMSDLDTSLRDTDSDA